MADDPWDPNDPETPQEQRIEREIRQQRGFSLADALAGRDGGGHLKGASPTPLVQRATLNLAQWLKTNLDDEEGALRRVILRGFDDRFDLLERYVDDPAGAVARWLPAVLDSAAGLAELVRQADMEWGRLNQERPCFEREGVAPDPSDPYTVADVRRRLTDLLARTGKRDEP